MADKYEGPQRVVWVFSQQANQPLYSEKALEILLNLNNIPPEQLRQDPPPEKPLAGLLFILQKSENENFYRDGYGWLDLDSVHRIEVQNQELEVSYREQGFDVGDKFTTIRRYIYRIPNSSFYLMHYVKFRDQRYVPTQPHLIKIHPTPLRRPIKGQPTIPIPNMQKNIYADPNMPRQNLNDKDLSQPTVEESEGDLIGGIFSGKVTNKQLAISRYKRNHEFMNTIFSVYHANAFIEQPNPDDIEKQIEAIKSQKATLEKEIAEDEEKHGSFLQIQNEIFDCFSKDFVKLKNYTDPPANFMENLKSSLKSIVQRTRIPV